MLHSVVQHGCREAEHAEEQDGDAEHDGLKHFAISLNS
jgi:hypothetical protein